MNGTEQVTIRPEEPRDMDAVYAVNELAFERPEEARLVNVLRKEADPIVSLVAELDDQIIGHILFSPVTVEGAKRTPKLMFGLAPMAVLPEFQMQGVGSLLVRTGLDACKARGCGAVVVLGHPGYYPRFGFVPASRFGLRCEYPVPDDVFLALELMPCALDGCRGLVKYHAAFAAM